MKLLYLLLRENLMRTRHSLANRSKENVILEGSFLDRAIGECHLPVSVLDPLSPLSLIEGAVRPEHLAIAIALVI